ncbi:hypothetical protein BGZ75_009081 [Mortierella antarctica]|nr:hypothetical protein BGZ75_009081 [Mortierella antarctica]
MTLLALTRVSALAISLLPLIAFQNKAPGPSSIVFAAPAGAVNKRLLTNNAPLADTIDGAHILLRNDVDSATYKNSFLLLSKPRSYTNAAKACQDMRDMPYVYLPGSPAAEELNSLLKSNAVTQSEVATSSNYWVFNAPLFPGADCMSLNKETGELEVVRCFTELPIICLNSAPRRTVLFQDVSRQVVVNTRVGSIQGFRDQNSFRFLGIKYAEAPIGKLRFAAPVPKAPFTSTFDATAFGYICTQGIKIVFVGDLLDSVFNGAKEDEDCLGLNVFTPSLKSKETKGLPVMVYIHGGGFFGFAGSSAPFEPGNLVSRGGVVVVTFNYRLGMLGFTENTAFPRSEVPGNQAIHDQILALRWVKNHIANFGGDPTMVTVIGESAGATSVRALLSAPSAWDLYTNVIVQSDIINLPFKAVKDAIEMTTYYFFDALKCASTDIECARYKPIADVVAAQAEANNKMLAAQGWTTYIGALRPTVDNNLISAEFSDLVKSGQYNTSQHHVGYAKALKDLWGAQRQDRLISSGLVEKYRPKADTQELLDYIFTTFYYHCPLQFLSKHIASGRSSSTSGSNGPSPRIYNFRFEHGRGLQYLPGTFCGSDDHTCHGEDIVPGFGSGTAFMPIFSQTGDDARFSRQIIDRFTSFAKTGDPNPSANLVGVENTNTDVMGLQWLPYGEGNQFMRLDLQSRMSAEDERLEDDEVCGLLEKEVKYDFMVHNPTHPELPPSQ